MTVKFKKRISKMHLVLTLIKELGLEQDHLTTSDYGEGLTLYYYKGYHVASHQQGVGWIFDWAYDKDVLEAKVAEQNKILATIK